MPQTAIINSFTNYKKLRNGEWSLTDKGTELNFCDWHILAEGDSWFHLNRKFGIAENLILSLEFTKPTAIANLAMAGDNESQMIDGSMKGLLNKSRVAAFTGAVNYQHWDMYLISAGGNDLIDAFDGGYIISDTETVKIIKENSSATKYEDYINHEALTKAIKHIKDCFIELIYILRLNPKNTDTKIITHTYDYFTLRNCKTKKSKRQIALEKHNIPIKYWKQIAKHMNEALRNALLSFNNNTTFKNVVVIDTLGTLAPASENVPGNTGYWRN